VFDDIAMQALSASVAGLSARQRALADNVSNINTSNYHAKRVVFEASLQSAIANGNPSAATVGVKSSLEPTNTNGNNVNLDEETISLIDTGLKYQTDIQALTAKYQLLRTSIGGNG
jgi:flagellar basal-body rod protein FlgB